MSTAALLWKIPRPAIPWKLKPLHFHSLRKRGTILPAGRGSNGTTAQTEVTIVKGNTGNKGIQGQLKPITYTLKLADTVSKNADGRADLYQKFGGSGMTVAMTNRSALPILLVLPDLRPVRGILELLFMNLTENQGETVILTPVWKTDAIYSIRNGLRYGTICPETTSLARIWICKMKRSLGLAMAQSSHSQGRSMVKIILSAILKRIRDFFDVLAEEPA